MNTKRVQSFRTYDDGKQSLGILTVTDTSGVCFVARTLELPWKDNQNNISSFTPGKYLCRYTRSNSFSAASLANWLKANPGKKESDCPDAIKNIYTYEIIGVPNRAGCRIHSANFVNQLRGCIAMGDAHKDINADGLSDVVHSGNTVEAFEKFMNYEDFELEIIKAY